MNHMLGSFQEVATKLARSLSQEGYWCVAIDPLSGFPVAFTPYEHKAGVSDAEDTSQLPDQLATHTGRSRHVSHVEKGDLDAGTARHVGSPAAWHLLDTWVQLEVAGGERYSEMRGASALLGFGVREGPCTLLEHPVHGTAVYPATLFTSAPTGKVKEALVELAKAT